MEFPEKFRPENQNFDRKLTLNVKKKEKKLPYSIRLGWKPLPCQREDCNTHPESNEVVKLCLDHRIAINDSNGDNGPLLALCYDCSEEAREMEPPVSVSTQEVSLVDLLLPIAQVSVLCDSSSCRSTEKTATVSCFSQGCVGYNSQKPIRYCAQCHSIRHNNRRGGDHVFHCNLTLAWHMAPEMQSYVIETVVR